MLNGTPMLIIFRVVYLNINLNIQRRLKYRLSRTNLDKLYLVYIRPLFEYACELWDNCCGIGNCTVGDIFLESGIFRAIFICSQIYQPIIVNFRPVYVISCSLQIKNSKISKFQNVQKNSKIQKFQKISKFLNFQKISKSQKFQKFHNI